MYSDIDHAALLLASLCSASFRFQFSFTVLHFRCTNIVFFLSIFRENLHPFCELKILYYLCIPFRTQNAAASNQVVFSDGLHVMSLPEGVCERVVIGSQARLRIWCLRAYGFESLRSHIFKRLGNILGLFFCACGWGSGQSLRASRFRTPLSLRDISRGRTETSAAVSVARTFFRDRGIYPRSLFLCARGWSSGKCSIQVLRKRGRRCGRGRHGRPWPCEWDVGREPDRDERSEPPTAAPPPGAIQTLKKRKTTMAIQPFSVSGRRHALNHKILSHK